MRKSFGFILLSILFLAWTGRVYAASVTYLESPQDSAFTSVDELTFQIKLSINVSNNTNYYLRGVFYKKDTSNYCGFTWNGSAFFSGPYSTNEGWKQFPKVTIQENNWEGEIRVKIDNNDNGCSESGEYGFKLQRFTESGSATFDTQDEKLFTFIIPTPTPTLSPTSTPTPTSKPTKSPTPVKSGPTATPSKSPTSTSTKSLTPTFSSNISPTPTTSSFGKKSTVLGLNNTQDEIPTPTITIKEDEKSSSSGKIIVVAGGVLLALSSGALMYKKYKKEKDEELF